LKETVFTYPITNAGNFIYEDLKMLKEVNVSMGMMLESSSKRLMDTIAHRKSPGKDPEISNQNHRRCWKNLKSHTQQVF